MTDSRLLPFLALVGLLAAKTTTGSRGVVRRGRDLRPLYEVIGMTGDNDPLENGGGVVFKDFGGRTLWWTWSSVKAKHRRYDVYQVDLDPDSLANEMDHFGPDDLADALGVSQDRVHAMVRDPSPMTRVRIPEAAGTIHGLGVLDEALEYTYQQLVDRFFRTGSRGVVRSPRPAPTTKNALRQLQTFREENPWTTRPSHRGPSTKTLIMHFGGVFAKEGYDPKEAADTLKSAMTSMPVRHVLDFANRLLGGHGVESLGGGSLRYVNRGDTYTKTLIFDWRTKRYAAGDWGSIVERDPKRFP